MKSQQVTDKKPNSTERVLDWLAAHPGWHTVKDIDAELKGVARGTIGKALKGLWDKNEVRRQQGAKDLAKGTTEPDRWAHPTQEVDTADTEEPDVTTGGDNAHEVSAAPATTLGNVEDDDSKEAAPPTSSAISIETKPEPPADDDGRQPPTEDDADDRLAPTPVRLIVNAPDVEVIAAAGVLGDHRESGITVAELAAACGIPLGLAWRIILAMDVAGAAVSDAAFVLDESAKWRPGEGDMSAVRIADAPTTVLCPTCNHSGRIPGSPGKAGAGPGRRADGICADGAPPLPQGALSAQVKAYVATHPGEEFTPGHLTKAIGARSSGAVLNALVKLAITGEVSEVSGAARRTFRTAPASSSKGGNAAA